MKKVKVIYCKRTANSGIHVHSFSSASILYVPELKLSIGSEQNGTFGGSDFILNDYSDYILEEMKILDKGEIPESEGITFENIHEFEMDKSKIEDIVDSLRSIKERKEYLGDTLGVVLGEMTEKFREENEKDWIRKSGIDFKN